MINGKMYRQDNAPHHEEINTFPKHFHQGTEDNVKESKISSDPEKGVIEFLDFVKKKIGGESIFDEENWNRKNLR